MRTLEPPETFGAWLKSQRRILDLTQADLGRLAGCSGAAVRKFEAEERRPSRQLAGLLADALQIAPQDRQRFLQMARGALPEGLPVNLTEIPVPNPVGGRLPAPLTSLVDRVEAAAAITMLLLDPAVRWLTLTGPPGIGKTRLAIQSARQTLARSEGSVIFPDGAVFVDLAPLADPEEVTSALARTLAEFGMSVNASLDDMAASLANSRLLLVLDNFEHLPGAAVRMAGILKRCGGLKILATSRIALHIYGEHRFGVPPLTFPHEGQLTTPADLMTYESVQLLAARARQHTPKFAVTAANAGLVREICAGLEGVPLALELAAASLQHLSLAELAATLQNLQPESWIRLIGNPAPDLPARQHTLENVVAWSYRLLESAQKDFFTALSLFPAWFDADAACGICIDPAAPIQAGRRLLDELTGHSLLERDDLDTLPRWRMLAVIREYAHQQLDPFRRTTLEAHFSAYYQRTLQPDPPDAFLNTHAASLLTALKWLIDSGETEAGFRMAENLEKLWAGWGYFRQGLALLNQLFALPDQAAPEERVRRLELAADLAWQVYDFESSLRFTQHAADLSRRYGFHHRYPWYLNRLGRILIEKAQYAEAREYLEQSLKLARQDPGKLNPGIPLAQLGEIALFENSLEEAEKFLTQAITLLSNQEPIFFAMACTDLAETALVRGEFNLAASWIARAIPAARQQMRRSLVLLCARAGWLVLANPNGADSDRQAARLFGALETWSQRSGVRLAPFYLSLNQSRRQAVLLRLGEAFFQFEYNRGAAWEWPPPIESEV